ncbi:MAG TPA: sigma-54 dependent transcriptional regulator [Polyangia bacterium]|nr:sigma-54 dependent transcriptional regulator [Polyangia bacterium]
MLIKTANEFTSDHGFPFGASGIPARTSERPVSDVTAFGELIARSQVMRDLFSRLRRLAERETTLLVEGESGTGKELVARAVHMASPRRSKPFIVVDCSAIPRNLIEAELFGHARGAFTGATQAHPGKFVAADGGTVFLDEIGELELDLQPRLLRVLERREVCPVGGTTPVPIDVRVISATNRNLRQELRRGAFREDLFYRLAVASVKMPPLRERTEDISVLIDTFLARHAARDGQPHEIDAATRRRLCAQPWPGNVRQLRNAVEELVALGEDWVADDDRAGSHAPAGPADPLGLFKEEKARVLAAFEERYLTALLARHNNNITASAAAAGLDRVHLLRLLDKHNLRVRHV